MNTCPDCGGVIGIECFPQPDGECLLTWLGRWNGDDPPSDCACNGCLGRGSCSECYGTGHAHPHAARLAAQRPTPAPTEES